MSTLGSIATWFLIFLAYSFAGWLMEFVISIFLNQNHKPSNRGFLIGPLCPIYGSGALVISFILRDTHNILEVFIVALTSSAILEYATSYIMEKIFRVRWWDYSDKKFNLNGRIYLKMLIWFGFFGIAVTQIANPFLLTLFGSINEIGRIAIAGTLFCILLTDALVTLWLIVGCRATAGALQIDATDEISANIHDILMGQGKLNRRLATAFPTMEVKQKRTRKTQKTAKKKT